MSEADLRVEQPPEDWPFKAFDGDAMVDVIFRIGGDSVEPALIERASEVEVLSIRMPVPTRRRHAFSCSTGWGSASNDQYQLSARQA